MRNPKRIPIILKELEEYWTQHPDLRLGQIVSNFASPGIERIDPFYTEDRILFDRMQEANTAKTMSSGLPRRDQYTVRDVEYYINEINDLVNYAPLSEKLARAIENKEDPAFTDNSIAPETVQILGKSLSKTLYVLQIKSDEKIDAWNREQRAMRGYSDYDVSIFSSWFLCTVRPMLEQLAENHDGYPSSIDSEYFEEHKNEVAAKTYLEFRSNDADEESRLYKERQAADEECSRRWNSILNRLAFLLGEMNEDTCLKKNPFKDAVDKAYEEFEEKYGLFGDGLKSEEELKEEKKSRTSRLYFPYDEPGRTDVQDLFEKYHKEERKLMEYRNQCKDEFFRLFSKYFYDLLS